MQTVTIDDSGKTSVRNLRDDDNQNPKRLEKKRSKSHPARPQENPLRSLRARPAPFTRRVLTPGWMMSWDLIQYTHACNGEERRAHFSVLTEPAL